MGLQEGQSAEPASPSPPKKGRPGLVQFKSSVPIQPLSCRAFGKLHHHLSQAQFPHL